MPPRTDQRTYRAKRDYALQRTELRSADYYTPCSDKLPDAGIVCRMKASDERGEYRLPFPGRYDYERKCWVRADTGEDISVPISGWYRLPKQTD